MARTPRASAVLGITAIMLCGALSASASAALPEFSGSSSFEAASGGVTLEGAGATFEKVKCKSSRATGSFEAPKTVKASVTYEGCKGPAKTVCTGYGDPEGDITNFSEEGVLGYTNAAKHKVGVDFVGLPSFLGPIFTLLICETKAHAILFEAASFGSVVGELTPTRKVYFQFKLKFKQKLGVEEPTTLEGQSDEPLTGKVFLNESSEVLESGAGVGYTQTVNLAHAVEIKA
jgi:hypothetical protein